MKVAIISDIHGNIRALDAVLDDCKKLSIDQIVCAGDTVNPLRESLLVWNRLKELKIPVVRGNHEDFIINNFYQTDNLEGFQSTRPVKLVADYLGSDVADEFSKLPLSFKIEGPDCRNLYVCHASPLSNEISFYDGIGCDLEKELESVDEQIIISGHCHAQWSAHWKNKELISVGSVGMSLTGAPKAQYLILEYSKGTWSFSHRSIDYDSQETAKNYVESGWVYEGGPFAWLFYDQFVTGEGRLERCLDYLRTRYSRPYDLDANTLRDGVINYFKEINRWQEVQKRIN